MAGEAPGRVAESGTPPSARFALWTLIALAAVSPWPFGSTPSWAVRSLTWISLATALVVSLAQVRRGALGLPRAPLWPVAILVALGFTQLVPLPPGLHALLAPGSAAVWHPAEPAAAALLGSRARPISIDPAATSAWLGLTSGVVALGLLAAPALGRRRTMVAAAWTLVGAGSLVAVYGIVARTAFGPLLYGYIAVPTVSPFGPFVNKNHFAGYVEMPALLALGLGRGLWRQAASAPSAATPSASPTALVALGASAIMVMAVLLSMSRGGALGVVSGIAVVAVVDFMTARHRGALGKVLVPVGLGLLLAVLVAVMPGDVHERLMGIGRSSDNSTLYRKAIWKDSLRACTASPLFGQGMGAFADVIPRFKTSAGLFRVDHPENEPIEIAVEGGVIALFAAATAVVVTFARSVRAIRGHRDRVLRGIVTGALAGVAALTVHGLVDFNLRIPSNALMFVALYAVTVAPLGTVSWQGRSGGCLVAALAAVAIAYARAPDAWPLLREAHASAVKSAQSATVAGAALRVSMADA
ncbi:MAG TPA: O-antigen ligase family protein, partial [Vicinamibacteria bacterium]|nr:O-antigen ligase family protein [Vicinamibacteria bacterium]